MPYEARMAPPRGTESWQDLALAAAGGATGRDVVVMDGTSLGGVAETESFGGGLRT